MHSFINLTLNDSNLTSHLNKSPHDFNLLNFFFNHIYLLLLVIIGCIGNSFVIIVFGQRALRTTIGSIGSNMSVYPFLFYMAISDTIYLSILFCLWLSNYINILHRPIICQLTLYLTYVCNFINAYYTVSFTAQRLFAVVQPFRVSLVLSWYRSKCLALCIIIFACLIYSYLPFLVGIVNGQCYSLEHLRWINKLMDIIDCIIVFLIPYIMIITMNTIILISLRRMKHIQHEYLFQNNSQLNKIREITRRNASRKMTKLLLTVSTSYLIVCGPYACIHTWRLLYSDEKFQTKLLRQLEYYFHLIYHISFAMNFYIYIVFGSKFRHELKRFLNKCQINFNHCFQNDSFDEQDTSTNQNNSSTFEQFQLINQNTLCPTLTTAGFTFQYKWKHPKGSYI
ncbi:unnamed protein product [Adineta steineri]|uniref:G-protein coupled receptors family 1 profile domain-containing protein n=1 Tax=Adineta steineri TaxID=433720 RepID=A0A814U7V7_9BILA|nr:unnamed protein product [Adineta steineri]CAF1149666.1 unnamed protein product [Adineta steineri]CAF1171592.1 unnamed protein product [Adineta steineri]CAF3534851.1 unnamed protein product [Adineta steineri]CAF3601574.1 unnamed protein product [Adineta steineri]